MATTERMIAVIPIASEAILACQSSDPNPAAAHDIKVQEIHEQPTRNNIQTLIDARTLKIDDIFSPPLKL